MRITINNYSDTNLGDVYKTFSNTPNTIASSGNLTFFVENNLSYIINQDIIMLNPQTNYYMNGNIVGYDLLTGELNVSVTSSLGDGTYNDWVIGLDASSLEKLYKYIVDKPSGLDALTGIEEGDVARALKPNTILGIVSKKEGAYTYTDGAWVYANRSLQTEILQNDLDIEDTKLKISIIEEKLIENDILISQKQDKLENNGDEDYEVGDYLNDLSTRDFVTDFQTGLQ